MKSSFKIFELVTQDGQIHLREPHLSKEVFKYHDGNGDFKSYLDANIWLKGLSLLKGQFVIMEVYTKSK